MRAADDYLACLQLGRLKQRQGFELFPPDAQTAQDIARRQRIRDAFVRFSEEDLGIRLGEVGAGNQSQDPLFAKHWLERFLRDLFEEVQAYADPAALAAVRHCVVGFLPTARLYAFCLSRDDDDQALTSPVIGLSYGLFYICTLLANCLIAEQLQGDLAAYNRDGTPFFQQALGMYLADSPEQVDANLAGFDDLPEEAEANLHHIAGGLASIMMFFIAQHEVGHIARGHLEGPLGLARYNLLDEEPDYSRVIKHSTQDQRFREELEADTYALESLIRRSSSPYSAWNAFASVYMFFHFCSALTTRGLLNSPDHPDPLDRANRLVKLMQERLGSPQTSDLNWIDERVKVWSQGAA